MAMSARAVFLYCLAVAAANFVALVVFAWLGEFVVVLLVAIAGAIAWNACGRMAAILQAQQDERPK